MLDRCSPFETLQVSNPSEDISFCPRNVASILGASCCVISSSGAKFLLDELIGKQASVVQSFDLVLGIADLALKIFRMAK
jgi:hypothetical protein